MALQYGSAMRGGGQAAIKRKKLSESGGSARMGLRGATQATQTSQAQNMVSPSPTVNQIAPWPVQTASLSPTVNQVAPSPVMGPSPAGGFRSPYSRAENEQWGQDWWRNKGPATAELKAQFEIAGRERSGPEGRYQQPLPGRNLPPIKPPEWTPFDWSYGGRMGAQGAPSDSWVHWGPGEGRKPPDRMAPRYGNAPPGKKSVTQAIQELRSKRKTSY